MRIILLGLLAVGWLAGQAPAEADLVIRNARVFTGDPARPWAEAIAIRGDRIVEVAARDEARGRTWTARRTIDAGGRLLVPGINDAHTHVDGAPPMTTLEGPPAVEHDPTLDEVIARIKVAVGKAPAQGWISGEIGATVLTDPRATRTTFDPITGGHPLLLTAWTGHGTIVNTAAMRVLNIAPDAKDPAGGFFARASDGTLTGLAHEYADYALRMRLSALASPSARRAALEDYAQQAASLGITSSQLMMTGSAPETANNELARTIVRLRLIDFPYVSMPAWRPRPRPAPASPLVTLSGTKWILDGTPIERLMLLREPYTDAPASKGTLNFPEADVRTFLRASLAAREQPMFHAVGDGAIEIVLAALEATGGEQWKPLRPRIEHGDMFSVADAERAKRMGVVIVQNPSHFMLPQYMAPRLGPERLKRTTVVKAIVESGVPLALGSDGPMNPFLNIMFATINANNPSQALSVEQALKAYTAGSAYAEFAETSKGMIRPGMLADVALLSQDIFIVPPPELPKTVSVLTVVNGQVVFERQN